MRPTLLADFSREAKVLRIILWNWDSPGRFWHGRRFQRSTRFLVSNAPFPCRPRLLQCPTGTLVRCYADTLAVGAANPNGGFTGNSLLVYSHQSVAIGTLKNHLNTGAWGQTFKRKTPGQGDIAVGQHPNWAVFLKSVVCYARPYPAGTRVLMVRSARIAGIRLGRQPQRPVFPTRFPSRAAIRSLLGVIAFHGSCTWQLWRSPSTGSRTNNVPGSVAQSSISYRFGTVKCAA